MNFVGSAAFWSQSVETILQCAIWPELCATICSRFERDQQSHLNRQFFRLKQTSTVSVYIEQIDDLIHQILAHDPHFSPHVIISRFIDGLQDAIHFVVLVHRPASLDAACSLTLLQEEVLSDAPSKDSKRQDGGSTTKHSFTRWSPPRSLTANPSTGNTKQVEVGKQSGVEEKLHNIKQYRRAKGLCFKCGDKWNPAHKCSNTVSLNLVEELWQILSDDDDSSYPKHPRLSTDSGEDLIELSLAAVQGTTCIQSVLMEGKIYQHPMVLLIDSDSSRSFVSHSLASMLPDWSPLPQPVQIRVANCRCSGP